MAASVVHTIQLPEDSYELLVREARRRGVEPDALANELLRADLAAAESDLESALAAIAELRERLPAIDGLAVARAARVELERRVA